MSNLRIDAEERAVRYLAGHTIDGELGCGKDGFVFSTSSRTAVKVYFRSNTFLNELSVYERLREHDVDEVTGFTVPQLRGSDESLGVLEMTLVRPPFVLDFAGSGLDYPIEFESHILEYQEQKGKEDFGERWPEVLKIKRIFEGRFGIFLDDLSPRNVRFENDPEV